MNTTTNYWIEKVLETDKRRGFIAARERGRTLYCSLILGRNFRESVPEYLDRNPIIKDFAVWFSKFSESPKPSCRKCCHPYQNICDDCIG